MFKITAGGVGGHVGGGGSAGAGGDVKVLLLKRTGSSGDKIRSKDTPTSPPSPLCKLEGRQRSAEGGQLCAEVMCAQMTGF